MKKNILAILVLLFVADGLYAQNNLGTIQGLVLDSDTKNPLTGARISLLKLPDSTITTGGVTNEKGLYSINDIDFGRYVLQINYVGYSIYYSEPVPINRMNPNAKMGTTYLSSSAIEKDAVIVNADREAIEVGIDKRIINVDKMITNTGGTATDVLQQVPSVTVDIDGNVSLRGSQNVKILVDGRQSGLTGSQILEQIPATAIESIELITNPSAKYEAEGQSGIINLILKKRSNDGWNGLFTLNVGTLDKYMSSLNINYKYNFINIYANYDTRFFRMTGFSQNDQTTYLRDTANQLDMREDFLRYGNFHNVKLGTDINLSKNDMISLSGLLNTGGRDGKETMNYLLYLDSVPYNSFQRKTDEANPNTSYDLALNYKHNFGEKQHDLSFDVLYSYYDRSSDANYKEGDYLAENFPVSIFNQTDQKKINNSLNNLYTFQLDYTLPFSKDSKFETGVRMSLRDVEMDLEFYNIKEFSAMVLDTNISNRFLYDEKIYAAYVTYSNSIGDFKYMAGLRAEYSDIISDQVTIKDYYEREYLELFPSLFFKYDFAPMNAIQLNFTRRLNRPSFRNLNSFIDYEDPLNLRGGNPKLNPEFINSFELSHLLSFSKTTLNSTVFYKQTDNVISQFRTLLPSGAMFIQPQNMLKSNNYGLEFIVQQEILKFWRADGSFSYFNSSVEGNYNGNKIKNDINSWTAKANTSINLWGLADLQFNFTYNAPTVTIQGEFKEVYWADMAIKADIIPNTLTVNFRISDIFDTMTHESETYGANFESYTYWKRASQTAFLGITYRLNEFRKQKQKSADEERREGGDEM